ncbi:DUF4082 domain-containing protein [Lentzea sp. NPDC059081]|uniref:DUF4082 domain-containing protein n=1 Tax=Lentzea sp. NPDC059081 TaxID=3346719 RepID=UPI0036C66B5B
MSWTVPSVRVKPLWHKAVTAAAAALVLSGPAFSGEVAGTAHAAPPPQSHLYTPSNNGRVDVGESVLISGGGYEQTGPDALTDYLVSVDGGTTWNAGYRTATVGLGGETGIMQALWAYEFTPQEPGVYTIVSRVDTATEQGQVSAPRTVYVGVPAPTPGACYQCTFYTYSPVYEEFENQRVELGLRFRVDRPGSVTRIVTSWNTNEASRVRLWRGDGTLLADRQVSTPYAEPFTTPVPVVPGEEYVASFTSWRGRYRITENLFTATVVAAPFVLPAHAGVYSYDDGFPTQAWNDSHYWVTPEFQS